MCTTKRALMVVALIALGMGVLTAPAPASVEDRGLLQVPVEMSVDPLVFYPAHDDYLDYLAVRLYESRDIDETMRSIDFTITNEAGAVVVAERGNTTQFYLNDELHFGWTGHYGYTDRLYPEGTYTITLTVVDRNNRRKVMTQDVRLDPARWRTKTWRRTVNAAATVIDRDRGKCGALKRPARPTWSGSLGYRSRSCARRRESYAATANAIYFPRDPNWKWASVRLDIFGGSARGHRGSEIGYAYLTDEGKWLTGMTAGSRVRLHRGHEQYKRHFLGVADGKPHFIWSAGVGGGASYDVKSFTVVATYRVFS